MVSMGASTSASEAIAGPLISTNDKKDDPDDPNVQYLDCKNLKCTDKIRINYADRYLDVNEDTREQDWTPDHARHYCQDVDCNKPFGMFLRKHHCRLVFLYFYTLNHF